MTFDHEAERTLCDLYAFDYGLKWDSSQKKFRITPAVMCPRLAEWWRRVEGEMWERLVKHVARPDEGSLVVEFRHMDFDKRPTYRQDHDIIDGKTKTKKKPSVNKRKIEPKEETVLVKQGYVHTIVTPEVTMKHLEADHPFSAEPYLKYDRWRWPGEEVWRSLWGRWLTGAGGHMVWQTYGARI